MKPRLLALSIHPAPYRDPAFYEVYRRGRIIIEVRYFYTLDDGHREWEWTLLPFPSKNLNLCIPFFNKDKCHLGIVKELKRNYDVVLIPGYSRATSAVSIVLSEILNIPFILGVDSFRYGEEISKKIIWKTALRRRLLKRAAAIWVPGRASCNYLISQNVQRSKIFEGAYCFDSINLHNSLASSKSKRGDIRKILGLSEDSFVFLTVGNMIKTRRYPLLIHAFNKAAADLSSDLVMIGDGPDRSSIDTLIQASGIRHIHLLKAVPFHELFNYYAASDAYVHPGAEPFSTATELAAIAGLPVVATPYVGYVHDLIGQGVQPLLSNIDDEDGLVTNLRKLIVNRKFATELGEKTELAAIQRNSQWAAEELENAVFYAINKR